MSVNSGPLRVLVVDNEAIISDTLVLILKTKQWEAFAAYSAEEAVEMAETIHPEVLISDVVMGAMSGVDLAIYFAAQFPDCRVLLVSGHGRASQLISRAQQQGLQFPSSPNRFLRKRYLPSTGAPVLTASGPQSSITAPHIRQPDGTTTHRNVRIRTYR